MFDNFFKSINKVHQQQTRLASKISYYLPKVRTNYGKFYIRFFVAKVPNSIDDSFKSKSRAYLKNEESRIDYLQLLTGTLMYFIFFSFLFIIYRVPFFILCNLRATFFPLGLATKLDQPQLFLSGCALFLNCYFFSHCMYLFFYCKIFLGTK